MAGTPIQSGLESAEALADEGRLLILERSGLLEPGGEPELDRWTTELRRDVGAAIAVCALLGEQRTVIKSVSRADGGSEEPVELARGESVERHLARGATASGSVDGPSYIEAPITVGEQAVGTVGALEHGRRAWSERDRAAVENAAAAISTEIALRLSRTETARVRDLVASHSRVHDLIARAAPLPDVLTEVVRGIERHDPSLIACVVLLDPETSTLHPGAGPSLPAPYLGAIDGVVIGPSVGTCGSAAWSGRLTITEDIAEDPKWAPVRDFATGFGLRHCWSMPIKAPGGLVLGTLAFYGRQPRRPLPEHLALLADWARVAGIAIERHRALERLMHDARFDALTGLPNRTAIFEALEKAIERVRPESQLAVMFVDLDGLKELNDTLGHDRADEMLREIGERLSATVRSSDFVGRMSGDEFLVIAEDVARAEDAAQLGLRLLESVSKPLPGLDATVVTASIGISLVRAAGVDAREAVRQADSAMYEAKRSGRDRCVFYEGNQPVRVGRRLSLARELRGAERRGELSLVFQPVFSVASEQIVGVEALLRWNSPKFGPVSPAEFIPIAEDTGAIIPIGAWVLRESCEAIADLVARLGRSLELSVNVSTHQVANPGFALWVQQTIAHAEFPVELLTLEITETALMRPDAVTARNLRALADHGVRIVLDDFGTGFSSLCWLKEHPLQAIKVDRSFVTGVAEDPRDRAIIAAVIDMGRALGCTITAEGIETEEQFAALRTLTCERAQGFLLAKPLPLDDLSALLAADEDAQAA
jgi:diguanylate cyclase (GGDEF)-like protein